jgi:hypothetical protein
MNERPFICIAALAIILSGCYHTEVIRSREAPITVDSTMQFNQSDEAFYRGCIAGIAEIHIRANATRRFNMDYAQKLCETVRRQLSCTHLNMCIENEGADGI